MLPREAARLVLTRLITWPAVALIGPRQCGKTTLARSFGGHYFDLEQAADRLRLDLAWPDLVTSSELVVLDEAQADPAVFERLRGAIDADRARRGRFLLLGSVSPALMTHVGESLAGRLAVVQLTPLTAREIGQEAAAAQAVTQRCWLYGGYPDGGVLGGERFGVWQRDYLALLAARDLPLWGLPAKPQVTDRLFRMIAAMHGQQWNASKIGQGLGLTHPTVNSYLDYLEGAFLVRRLQPWHGNLGKRLTRRPRVYWRDSGLLHALQLVRDEHDLLGRPWVGASWEGFVIEQAIATLQQRGTAFDALYFRTSDGHEIDLLLEFGDQRWAIEIKLTTTPTQQHLRSLQRAADMVGASRRFVVCQVREPVASKACTVSGLAMFVEELCKL